MSASGFSQLEIASLVNTEQKYHVFLTPGGYCGGLYVTHIGKSSFEVRELNGGSSNIGFSYRIVAKREGYENQRLVRISKKQMTAMTSPAVPESEPAQEAEPEKVALRR